MELSEELLYKSIADSQQKALIYTLVELLHVSLINLSLMVGLRDNKISVRFALSSDSTLTLTVTDNSSTTDFLWLEDNEKFQNSPFRRILGLTKDSQIQIECKSADSSVVYVYTVFMCGAISTGKSTQDLCSVSCLPTTLQDLDLFIEAYCSITISMNCSTINEEEILQTLFLQSLITPHVSYTITSTTVCTDYCAPENVLQVPNTFLAAPSISELANHVCDSLAVNIITVGYKRDRLRPKSTGHVFDVDIIMVIAEACEENGRFHYCEFDNEMPIQGGSSKLKKIIKALKWKDYGMCLKGKSVATGFKTAEYTLESTIPINCYLVISYKSEYELDVKAVKAIKKKLVQVLDEIKHKAPYLLISESEVVDKSQFCTGINSITDSLFALLELSKKTTVESGEEAKQSINRRLLQAIKSKTLSK